jgi:L-threonylcarbamoyladenylate synthase
LSETEDTNAVKEAARVLARGQLVAFPTETVYGLGADAANPEALKLLFAAKGRPDRHPVIVHLADSEDLEKWCAEVPEAALILANVFWPGPLTLVLKKGRHVLDLVTGGQETVAVRVPGHPVAQELLREFGSGIAAPSANKFGRLSPTSAEDVKAEFGDEVPVVLDAGPSEIGIESTIVDLSAGKPRILRPGMIQKESIFVALSHLGLSPSTEDEKKPRVPGSTRTHYAPATTLRLVNPERFADMLLDLEKEGVDAAVLSFKAAPVLHRNWITASRFPSHYGHNLYRNLRKLDSVGADLLIVEEPPSGGEWEAIWDRLRRACGSSEDMEECDGS